MENWRRWLTVSTVAAVLLVGASAGAAPIGYQAVPRDSFPVFDNPVLLSVAEAEAKKIIFERDAVIGISIGGEAKAYPITIMGVHELGNDTIGGVPIAVSW